MTITATQTNDNGASYRAQGRHLNDAAAAAVVLSLGFVPRYVQVVNLTDRISYEWYEGMAAGTTLKTAANGDRTLDTSDVAISVDAGSGDQDGAAGTPDAGTSVITTNTATAIPGIAPGGLVTIAAAVVLEDKQLTWVAIG